MRKDMLTSNESRLIDLANDIGFGSIQIRVRNGKLLFAEKLKVSRTYRLDKDDEKNPKGQSANFILKRQQQKLIERIRRIEAGVVTIHIGDGLPATVRVDEIIDDQTQR